MQVCTSLQTDNHASTPPLSSLQAFLPPNQQRQSTEGNRSKMAVTWLFASFLISICSFCRGQHTVMSILDQFHFFSFFWGCQNRPDLLYLRLLLVASLLILCYTMLTLNCLASILASFLDLHLLLLQTGPPFLFSNFSQENQLNHRPHPS